MFNWFKYHDREKHAWAGFILSLVALMATSYFEFSRWEGFIWDVGFVFLCALAKEYFSPSRPDKNDITATMAFAWILPLLNFVP